jgi:hypothetical protein
VKSGSGSQAERPIRANKAKANAKIGFFIVFGLFRKENNWLPEINQCGENRHRG